MRDTACLQEGVATNFGSYVLLLPASFLKFVCAVVLSFGPEDLAPEFWHSWFGSCALLPVLWLLGLGFCAGVPEPRLL